MEFKDEEVCLKSIFIKFCNLKCCICLAGVLKNHITCQGKRRKEGREGRGRGRVRRKKGGRKGRTEAREERKELFNFVKPCVVCWQMFNNFGEGEGPDLQHVSISVV